MEIAVPVRERPIPFIGSMVRAILAGEKSVTRRLVKPMPPEVDATARWSFTVASTERADRNTYCLKVLDPQGMSFTERGREREVARVRPYARPCDLLWVRETWGIFDRGTFGLQYAVAWRATDEHTKDCTWIDGPEDVYGDRWPADERWHPPMFMPRWASRLTLRVTDVRVERLQEITEEDAKREGCAPDFGNAHASAGFDYRRTFARGWDAMHGKKPGASWADSPWVWRIAFDRVATVTP